MRYKLFSFAAARKFEFFKKMSILCLQLNEKSVARILEVEFECTMEKPVSQQGAMSCHSIFALSLTRFAFRNPNGITYCYATFDLLLQNSSITKRCFVILSET